MTTTIDAAAEQPSLVDAAEPRVRSAVAILVSRFPRIDETFILREINELERQGQPVVLVPLMREAARVIHEEAKPWIRRALYLPLLSLPIVRANLIQFFRQPLRYLGLLLTLIGGTILHPKVLLRTLLLFPKSVYLSRELPRQGIRHVHAHFATNATTMALIISSLTDITYSFTVHGPDIFVHRHLLAKKIAKAKFIRSVSIFNKAFLRGLYPLVTEDKVEVVHIGLNPDVYAQAASQAPRAKARPVILSVAALAPSKGFPFLIDAIARLKTQGLDMECRIVGDGPLRDVTERWIVQHGLQDTVRVTGLLPQHEVARLMGECDVFVLPSVIANNGNMDGVPISLMEAMAAGRPVVVSALSGIPELVENEISGLLVDATNPDRIAAAIRRLMENDALRASLGSGGQRRVGEHFNIRQTASSLIGLFERHDEEASASTESLTRLNWRDLDVCAIGVHRVRDRRDSRVAEVTITDGVSHREVVVKQQKAHSSEHRTPAERARREFRVLLRLRSHLVALSQGATSEITYALPRVLMFDSEHAAIVMERARGVPLQAIVRDARHRRKPASLVAPLRRVGTWLRIMEEATRTDEDGRQLLSTIVFVALRDLDIAAIDDRLIRKSRNQIVDRLHALESNAGKGPLATVGTHGDFWPGNVFLGDRRVDVIDFEWYRDGLRFEDAAYFLVHLQIGLGTRLFRGEACNVVESFLAGYGGTLSDSDRNLLDLFTMIKSIQLLARSADGARVHAPRERGLLRELLTGTR